MHNAILLSAALAAGCAGASDAPDAGAGRHEGGRAETTMRLRHVWWSSTRDLNVVVIVENHASTPFVMSPGRFTLDSSDGPRRAVSTPDPAACTPTSVVLTGERGRCVLRFATEGTPTGVRHRPSGLAAPIASCAPRHRDGLCPFGERCREGACSPLCGPTRWDGGCVEDAICAQGECRSRCSSEDPESACEEGRCVGGRCRTDCPSVAWPDRGCAACAAAAGCAPPPGRCRACEGCPRSPTGDRDRFPTTCDCLERQACDGCAEDVAAYWRCVLDRCPACRE